MVNNKKYWIEKLSLSIKYIAKDIAELQKEIKLLVVDKEIPLDERWSIFSDFCFEFHKGLSVQKVDSPFSDFQEFLKEQDFDYLEEIEIEQEINKYQDDRFELEDLEDVVTAIKEWCLKNFIYTYYNQ